jgi:hypothetical protein
MMWDAIKTVGAAFFGVRSRAKASLQLRPWQIICAGVVCAGLLALLIWLLAQALVAGQY